MGGMKQLVILALAALVLVATGCGAAMPTPTPAPTSIPVPTPTSTPIPIPAPTATIVPTPVPAQSLDPARPTASYILESAIENLRTASSFHVEAQISGGNRGRWAFISADIVNPDWGRIYESWSDGLHGERDEMLTIDGYNYYRPADFQVWFDSGDIPSLQREIQGFPYELGLLKAGIKDLTLESSESGEDAAPYRLKGTATQGLAAAIGFYSAHTWAKGIAEVEILISGDDLLPTRFEGGIDGFNASFSVEYSNFGANLEVSLPEEAWDFDYLQRLRESTLSVEEMGRMLRVFPVEGQKCVEVDIGSGLYLKSDFWRKFRRRDHKDSILVL